MALHAYFMAAALVCGVVYRMALFCVRWDYGWAAPHRPARRVFYGEGGGGRLLGCIKVTVLGIAGASAGRTCLNSRTSFSIKDMLCGGA